MLTRYFIVGLLISAGLGFAFGEMVGGASASILFGFMAGNFACSLIHRLPRGKALLEHKPYCGECAHPLNERDLLPVFGVLLLRHKCRYCSAPIPKTHLWTELLIGALYALCFLQFGFSEHFLMVAGVGIFLIILTCIDANEGKLQPSMLVVVAVLAMIYRTLLDGEIFGFLQGGLYGLIVGALLWRSQIKPVGHVYSLPDGAKLLALAGIITGPADFWLALVVFAVLNALLHLIKPLLGWVRVPLTLPIAIAVMLPLLFPKLSLPVLFASLSLAP